MADPRVEITYEPGLLGKPRYPNDQHGGQVDRTPEEERRWLGHLSKAEVVFGYLKDQYASRLEELATEQHFDAGPCSKPVVG